MIRGLLEESDGCRQSFEWADRTIETVRKSLIVQLVPARASLGRDDGGGWMQTYPTRHAIHPPSKQRLQILDPVIDQPAIVVFFRKLCRLTGFGATPVLGSKG